MTRLAWIRILLVAGFFGVLEILCRTRVIKPITMIPPSEMVRELGALLASGSIYDDIRQTLAAVAIALVLSVASGFAIGVVLHAVPRLRRAVDPLLATYYAVPFFVFYPVLVAIFGLSQWPVIVIAFMFAVVAMVISTLNGLDRIPRVLGKVARVHNMGAVETALRLKLPAAAPHLFTGLKLAVAYSFIGVIACEFIMAASGLGYAIAYAYNNFDNRTMYALMLFVLALVTAINMALHVWERRFLRRRLG
ncbi:MAG TPA: ABC transporter permease [Alphaproteobacteria bacterium]